MAHRTIHFYKDYFQSSYLSQTEQVRRKINYCLNAVRTIDRVPVTILKSISREENLFEIRVEFGGNIFRIFCCFDEGSLVILFNGFQKKTQKTPSKEIERAKRIKKNTLTINKMDKVKRDAILNAGTFDELLDIEYGIEGTPEREQFDADAAAFCLAETLKAERIKAGLTQEQLADRIGTKKTYISRLENGKADIKLNTLFRIFEGLGRKVSLTIL